MGLSYPWRQPPGELDNPGEHNASPEQGVAMKVKVKWAKAVSDVSGKYPWLRLGSERSEQALAAMLRKRGPIPVLEVVVGDRVAYPVAKRKLVETLERVRDLVLKPGNSLPAWVFRGADSLPGGQEARERLFRQWLDIYHRDGWADGWEEEVRQEYTSPHFEGRRSNDENHPDDTDEVDGVDGRAYLTGSPERVSWWKPQARNVSLSEMEREIYCYALGGQPDQGVLEEVLALLEGTGSQWPSEFPKLSVGISPLFLIWRAGRRERWARKEAHLSYDDAIGGEGELEFEGYDPTLDPELVEERRNLYQAMYSAIAIMGEDEEVYRFLDWASWPPKSGPGIEARIRRIAAEIGPKAWELIGETPPTPAPWEVEVEA